MGRETMEILELLYLNIKIQLSMESLLYFFKFKNYNKLGVNVCKELPEVITLKTFINIKNHNFYITNKNFKNRKLGFLKLRYGQ